MLTGLLRFLTKGLSHLSSSQALSAAGVLARIILAFNTESARVTRRNIELCFPRLSDVEQAELVKESMLHTALFPFGFSQIVHWPYEKLQTLIDRVEGQELIEDALTSRQGLFVMMPHFGHFEFVSFFLGAGYAFAALFKPPGLAALESIITETRKRHGGHMYPTTQAGVRKLIRYMREGNLVMMLPDQVPDRDARGMASTFVGRPVLTMSLAHRIIKQNKPCVLFASVERVVVDGTLKYVLRFERGVEGVESDDEQTYADAVNTSIEHIIERAPAQYQWEYKRFKRAPGHEEKQDSLYRG